MNIWDKVFKNGPSTIFGRQPLKGYSLLLGLIYKYAFDYFCTNDVF